MEHGTVKGMYLGRCAEYPAAARTPDEAGMLLAIHGRCMWFATPFDPNVLICPFNGRVVAVQVDSPL